MFPGNPMLNQQMTQLEQEYAQKKANLMQSFYSQQQGNNWGRQNVPAQPPEPTQNVNWIQVPSVEEAKNQIVQPGHTAWMMDNNKPFFYVKAVDNVGSTTFRIFHIDEVREIAQEQAAQTQIDMSGYVQRDEFEQLKAQIEQLSTAQKKQPAKANKGVEDNG